MKIISLTSENIKKLTAVQITPDGNIVEISGKNGQGKTSVLDSIWWALAGMAHVQGKPIREGATEARITLDMGEVVVTRTFRDKEGAVTSTLKVEQDGKPVTKSPQALLDGLIGALSFDPLAFSRMDAKAQFNELRRFVPGIDFDAIDLANKKDYDERTLLNRQAKDEQAAGESIVVSDGEPIDETALVAKLADAAKFNGDIQTRALNRKNMAAKIEANTAQIDGIKAQISNLQDRMNDLEKETSALALKLGGAPALPAPTDVTALQKEIEDAKLHNATLGRSEEKKKRLSRAAEFKKRADDLSARIDKRNEEKSAAIRKADLPVKGISFGESVVNLEGVPFGQASDAEQLRASIAIAMASNSKLRVIRVRDGSLLDADSMALLSDMADKKDFQVWIERVGEGATGFIIEDGHVKAVSPSNGIPAAAPTSEKTKADPNALGMMAGMAASIPKTQDEKDAANPFVKKPGKTAPVLTPVNTQSDEDII